MLDFEKYEFKKEEVITIDLHNLTLYEAKKYLEIQVLTAPDEIKEIRVIHGHNSGKALLNMVRNEYKNERVCRKFLSMNQGMTSLILV